jgi:hypothetical protein
VTATDSDPLSGTVGIRSANSGGTVRPIVNFDGFWAQNPGLSIHLLWQPSKLEFAGNDKSHTTQILAKGITNGTSDHQMEYEMRFHGTLSASSCPGDPGCAAYSNVFKAYVFNLGGGLGAGVDYPWPGVPTTDGPPHYNPLSIQANCGFRCFHDMVVEYDPGDYLDPKAGVRLYVDGQLFMDTDGQKCAGGNLYNGMACYDALPSDRSKWTNPEWQIVPLHGTRPLHLGRGDMATGSTMNGWLDEVAVFPRLLKPSEIQSIWTARN